jgi:serine protease Do
MQPRERQARGLGSGVILSPNGYILTANHVIEGADEVKIGLPVSDKQYDARVIGGDPLTDIAVLKVDADQPFPAAVLGDSDKLQVGDMSLAVGNPFGVGQTVTLGIISALGRGGMGISAYENFIQTDAAINPGNSGGALVDVEGRLIGINTAIMSRSGGFQGVGFAVPINMARGVMDQLIKTGKVSRGYLGISIQPLTDELAKEFGLPNESSGVLVGGVMPKGAADKAGVEDGDVILEVNGKNVPDPRTLQLIISQTPPNSKVSLKILRTEPGDAKPVQKNLSVTLAELPRNAFGAPGSPEDEDSEGRAQIDALDGVEVADLDAQTRRRFSIPQSVRGALVVNVDTGSNAAESGLTPGDVIIEINRQAVHDADEAVEMSNKAAGGRLLLRIYSPRAGGTRYLVVDNTKH